MNEHEESYRSSVPMKPSNKGAGAPVSAERAEGRDLIKGKAEAQNSFRTQRREELQNKWNRLWQKVLSVGPTAHSTCDKNLVR